MTPEQLAEFQKILGEVKECGPALKGLLDLSKMEGGLALLKDLPGKLAAEMKRNDELKGTVDKLNKRVLNFQSANGVRWVGGIPFVTDDCAKAVAGVVILAAHQQGKSHLISKESATRERYMQLACDALGIEQKTSMTSTEVPLPTIYMPQITELVWKYGQARQFGTVWPLGAGTVKLPRLAAGEDSFAFMDAAATVNEKRVKAELVTFTANKMGGIIRLPFELEEDTFIQLGQFLTRYIARQFAQMEDKTMFLADGTATYASISGVGAYCTTNSDYLLTLAAGKTKPSDATLADFRALRGKVNPAVLVDDPAYYMNPTMEALLVSFNTLGAPLVYKPASAGQPATLDGFPIRWVGVMQPYGTAAAASKYLAFFGALKYWYLGERGAPRVESSREIYFTTDEIGLRALERIDVEAMAIDAMAALKTPAA